MIKPLLIILSFLLFLPNIFPVDINEVLPYDHVEAFDPNLSRLNTIEKVENYIDSVALSRSISIGDNLNYMEVVAYVLRERFYHGFSHYTLNENWIAAAAGKWIWYDLACKVEPEDIMQNDYAACSQQGLVLIAVLRNKKIPYRSVLFLHHYALEVMINKQWYYFDTNREPKISGEQRLTCSWHGAVDSVKRYYLHANGDNINDLNYAFGIGKKMRYGAVNEIPAGNARLFHFITKIASKTAWLLPLLVLFIVERKKKNTSTN